MDKFTLMLITMKQFGMNISADAIRSSLMEMTADSENTKFKGAFNAKGILPASH